jgi:hypothetical protein
MSQTQAIHTDSSLTEQDSQGGDKDKKAKTRKPASRLPGSPGDQGIGVLFGDLTCIADTAFRQQRLKAWQYALH